MDAVSYIQHWEGFRPRLYLCPAGYPTIGFGTRVATWSVNNVNGGAEITRAISADTGDWITREQATALMLPAVEAAEARARKLFAPLGWGAPELGQARQIVMTDLFYNMGSLDAFPRFRLAVRAGDWQRAHDELLWVDTGPHVSASSFKTLKTAYYRQTGRRAECNAGVLLTGEMDASVLRSMPEVLP